MRRKNHRVALATSLAILAAAGLINSNSHAGRADQPALKDIFKNAFLMGAALNQNQFTERDQRGLQIITRQFNSITPENVLKWESVHPQAGTFSFENPDA